MVKRLIGLDRDEATLRVAVLRRDQKGRLAVEVLREEPRQTPEQELAWLREVIGESTPGDRMAVCLPTSQAYVRWLQFPFEDQRKIAAALDYELGAQIPVPLDDCVTAMYRLQASAAGGRVCAAALPRDALLEIIEPGDAAGLPLQYVDLAPCCLAAGLVDQLDSGLLLLLGDREAVLGRIEAGRIQEFRILPGGKPAELTRALKREIGQVGGRAPDTSQRLYLAGSGATPELTGHLQSVAEHVEILSIELAGETVEAPFVPAMAAALRAGQGNKANSFNFRQGTYARKGEWASLLRSLVIAGGLAVLTLVALAVAMVVEYRQLSDRAAALQQEMVARYRQTFPDTQVIVDVPLQMQSALREMRSQSDFLGGEGTPSVLEVLAAVSAMTDALSFEIEELTYTVDQVRISGTTASFEAVNQLAERLGDSSLFRSVQVGDAKMALEGGQVEFRLTLALATGETGT